MYWYTDTNYPILEYERNYDPSVKKSVYETYYKENFIYAKDHGFVKVVHIFKCINGTIKLKVLKYYISPMFHHPISSDIKIFYAHDIIPKPSLMSIDVHKSVALHYYIPHNYLYYYYYVFF